MRVGRNLLSTLHFRWFKSFASWMKQPSQLRGGRMWAVWRIWWPRQKKQLPKDFEARLEKCDLQDLKTVFDACDVNARGGYSKQTALAFAQCPDELARWLVEHGADMAASDSYGETPLHSRSSHWKGSIEVLLELGADVNHGENMRGTPLHSAAGSYRTATAALLLRHGARIDALNQECQTPLAYALQRCTNAQIPNMAELAELFLAAGAQQTPEMKEFVARIGTNFEFHRGGFNSDSVEATSAALDKLYLLFEAPPVPRHLLYDGKSPIVARSANWEDQHHELWELLVPSRGAAGTVQGEVVRIAGRISDELERNGGATGTASTDGWLTRSWCILPPEHRLPNRC